MDKITKQVEKFYGKIKSVQDHRGNSWEHCHNFFKSVKNKSELSNEERELAQLHLAFYLASWGMYRGSSFILQKDYTVYNKIIDVILSNKYSLLWDLKANYKNKEIISLFSYLYENIEKELIDIKGDIIKNHLDLKPKKRESFKKNKASEILITKILLGTIGCIPAYDGFLKKGLKKDCEIQMFSKKNSFKTMISFYENNLEEINNLSNKYDQTPMRIIDIYFWSLGND